MELNWTIASILGLISIIPAAFLSLGMLYYYLKQRYRYVLLLSLAFLFFFQWTLLQEVALLMVKITPDLSERLYQVGNYFFIPGAFFLILSFDSIARESVDPKKIYLLITLCVVAIMVTIDPLSYVVHTFPNGEMGILISDLTMILSGNISILVIALFMYYSVRIYKNAPSNLKSSARFFLGGACILFFGMISIFSLNYIVDFQAVAPGLMLLIPSIASVFIGIALAREPKLAYLLPFKVIRLTVIEVHKGIALFTHTWSKKETLADENLFFRNVARY